MSFHNRKNAFNTYPPHSLSTLQIYEWQGVQSETISFAKLKIRHRVDNNNDKSTECNEWKSYSLGSSQLTEYATTKQKKQKKRTPSLNRKHSHIPLAISINKAEGSKTWPLPSDITTETTRVYTHRKPQDIKMGPAFEVRAQRVT